MTHQLSDGAQKLIVDLLRSRQQLAEQDVEDDGGPIVYEQCPVGDPLVSVEVLVYKQAPYLRQCIESIVCQKTTFPFEIIIGNDCSPDDSLAVAKELMAKYPDKIRIVSTTRNVGLNRNARNVRRLMRGKYAAFCEGDDWWCCDTRLQEQVDYLESHPECTLVHGLSRFYSESDQSTHDAYLRYKISSCKIADYIFDETYRIETATVMCRVRDLKRIYEECPQLIDAHFLMLDTQLFVILSRWGSVGLILKHFSVRRLPAESFSRGATPYARMRYYDSAFYMMRTLADYFTCSRWSRSCIANRYLFQLGDYLRPTYGKETTAILRMLYPEFANRIMLHKIFPMPRKIFFRKIYCYFLVPCHRYRAAFRTTSSQRKMI